MIRYIINETLYQKNMHYYTRINYFYSKLKYYNVCNFIEFITLPNYCILDSTIQNEIEFHR